ncbi:MAG: metal-dependent transcriptional regulator [Candidatus Bathyarchaeia archaeon]|jgi:DtxR family Mn-dependent transcriptional regulator
METALSPEAEDYIETIYKLQKRNGVAKTKELAQTMHVVPGSITNTIEHLESHGLVMHEPYRGVKLTREGEKIALDVIRRHRLAECLLTDVLKAEWTNVHEEACKLEHALTKNVANLVDKKLGYPKCCPHGNPIPTENGEVKEHPCVALTEANVGESYYVCSIIDEEHKNLQQLAKAKIKPKTQVQVMEQNTEQIVLSVEGEKSVLSRRLAANVLLIKNKEDYRCG